MPDQPVQMVGLGNTKATLALPYLLASPAKQVPLPPKTAEETVEDLFPQPSTSTPGSRQNGSGLPHKLQLLIADLNRNLSQAMLFTPPLGLTKGAQCSTQDLRNGHASSRGSECLFSS